MTTKGSSPDSDLISGDRLKYVFSDFNLKDGNGGLKIFLEPSTVSSTKLPKSEESKEKLKLRETASPILKRETSGTPSDEAGSVSTEETEEGRLSPGIPADKKRKVYLMPPMEDPEAERRRRNAVIAWKNRVRKKRETEALESQLERLRESSEKMEGVLQHRTKELSRCHDELKHVQAQVEELRNEKRALEIQNQTQQEKFTLIREHIILIIASLEEENLARRFLKGLLDRLSATVPASFLSQSSAFAFSSAHASSSLTDKPPHVSTSPPLATSPPHITSPPLVTSFTSSPPLRTMPSLIPVLPSSLQITPRSNS